MAMPWQLARAKRPPPGKSLRPIVEQLPSIAVHELGIPSPYDRKTYTMPNISLRLPQLANIKITASFVEFHHPSLHRGHPTVIQIFRLKPIRTGFGMRHAFICTCGRPVLKLYHLHRNLACRRCCRARYVTQTIDQRSRPVLQASRIQSFLDNKPRLFHRTQERLRKKLGEKLMMAQTRLGTRAAGLWE